MSKSKLSIRVELDENYSEMLEEIKTSKSLKSNTDAIRVCLFELSQKHNFQLDEVQVNKIKKILSNNHIKAKYSIFSINDFLNFAINKTVVDIYDNLPSIQHWDVRSRLNEEETEIAIALIKLQAQTPLDQVNVRQICDHLELRNEKHVENILDYFVNQNILSCKVINKIKVYHAKK